MDLKKLINLLPYQYKQRDTYKDGNGRGILERFLEICGTYLADIVTPDIDNALDLIDLDKVPSMYLNYIWEFLGEIPFAYGSIIDEGKFSRYYDGLKSPEELQELSKLWTIEKNGPIVLTDKQVRDVLRYAITLIKIRGTKLFFETLFKIYGFNCTIVDPPSDMGGFYSGWQKNIRNLDSEGYYLDDGSFIDVNNECTQCINILVNISSIYGFKGSDNQFFRDSNEVLYCGRYNDKLDLYAGITEYNASSIVYTEDQDAWIDENEELIFTGNLPASVKDFIALRRMVEIIFDKYLPYNVNPKISFQGLTIDDGISINITRVNPSSIQDTIVRGEVDRLEYKIDITSKYPYSDTRFKVNDGKIHKSGDIVTIYNPGTYTIKTLSQKVNVTPPSSDIDVSEVWSYSSIIIGHEVNTIYYPGHTGPSDTTEFTAYVKLISIKVWARVKLTKIVNGELIENTISIDPKLVVGTYKNKTKVPGLLSHTIYDFGSDTAGTFGEQDLVFEVRYGDNTRRLNIQLTKPDEVASLTVTQDITDDHIVTIDFDTNLLGGDLLVAKCLELQTLTLDEAGDPQVPYISYSDILNSRNVVKLPGDGIYHFYLEISPDVLDEDKNRAWSIDCSNAILEILVKPIIPVTPGKVLGLQIIGQNRIPYKLPVSEYDTFGIKLRISGSYSTIPEDNLKINIKRTLYKEGDLEGTDILEDIILPDPDGSNPILYPFVDTSPEFEVFFHYQEEEEEGGTLPYGVTLPGLRIGTYLITSKNNSFTPTTLGILNIPYEENQ